MQNYNTKQRTISLFLLVISLPLNKLTYLLPQSLARIYNRLLVGFRRFHDPGSVWSVFIGQICKRVEHCFINFSISCSFPLENEILAINLVLKVDHVAEGGEDHLAETIIAPKLDYIAASSAVGYNPHRQTRMMEYIISLCQLLAD